MQEKKNRKWKYYSSQSFPSIKINSEDMYMQGWHLQQAQSEEDDRGKQRQRRIEKVEKKKAKEKEIKETTITFNWSTAKYFQV